jgi:hypothetical protein
MPLTLVLTFFGINAREVDDRLSMLDPSYWPMYAIIAGILSLGMSLSIGLCIQQVRQARREAARAAEVMDTVRSMAIVNLRLARPRQIVHTTTSTVPGPRETTPETELI